jgi:hypothetical protein
MMSPREQRAIHNQELFRHVNLRIAELQEGSNDLTLEGLMPLVCECSHTGCTVPIEIDPAVFQRVRENPLQYVVAPGHEDLDVETVVERQDAYLIVEKLST